MRAEMALPPYAFAAIAVRICSTMPDSTISRAILMPLFPSAEVEAGVSELIARCEMSQRINPPKHRALADAQEEWQLWLDVKRSAEALIKLPRT